MSDHPPTWYLQRWSQVPYQVKEIPYRDGTFILVDARGIIAATTVMGARVIDTREEADQLLAAATAGTLKHRPWAKRNGY